MNYETLEFIVDWMTISFAMFGMFGALVIALDKFPEISKKLEEYL